MLSSNCKLQHLSETLPAGALGATGPLKRFCPAAQAAEHQDAWRASLSKPPLSRQILKGMRGRFWRACARPKRGFGRLRPTQPPHRVRPVPLLVATVQKSDGEGASTFPVVWDVDLPPLASWGDDPVAPAAPSRIVLPFSLSYIPLYSGGSCCCPLLSGTLYHAREAGRPPAYDAGRITTTRVSSPSAGRLAGVTVSFSSAVTSFSPSSWTNPSSGARSMSNVRWPSNA